MIHGSRNEITSISPRKMTYPIRDAEHYYSKTFFTNPFLQFKSEGGTGKLGHVMDRELDMALLSLHI